MPVAEYMLHANGHKREVPNFIGDRGHWYNPTDHTYIGWISENRDYYVPDTINYLTKDQFVARSLSIHSVTPFRKRDPNGTMEEVLEMTVEEVTAQAEQWYESFVSQNAGK